ncbi:MAG: hypothetical protein IKN71_05595 [Alphaproteobacteria bacterium]|nr:hypothetical protein [Alphaproteobacteria bacterium]
MTKAKIVDLILRCALIALAVCAFFYWSNHQVAKRVKAECELKVAQQVVITTEAKQKEVENVAKAKAVIHSRPNANRDSLLNAMRNGEL